jgi:hypothetical protein
MKQLIVILLIAGGCYYLYYGGFFKIPGSSDLSPKEFVGNIKSAADIMAGVSVKNLPEKAPQRDCGGTISQSNFNALKDIVFTAYDSKAAYALADLAYSGGFSEAKDIINKYLSLFTMPEEKNRILSLVTRYKDKESLDMLVNFLNNGTFNRKALLGKIADFKSPEAAAAIRAAAGSGNFAVRSEAKALIEELSDETWFNAPPKKQALPMQHTRELYEMPLAN